MDKQKIITQIQDTLAVSIRFANFMVFNKCRGSWDDGKFMEVFHKSIHIIEVISNREFADIYDVMQYKAISMFSIVNSVYGDELPFYDECYRAMRYMLDLDDMLIQFTGGEVPDGYALKQCIAADMFMKQTDRELNMGLFEGERPVIIHGYYDEWIEFCLNEAEKAFNEGEGE